MDFGVMLQLGSGASGLRSKTYKRRIMHLQELVADLPDGQLFSPAFSPCHIHDVNASSGQEKWRQIERPNNAMREVHRRLRRYLAKLKTELPYAIGARAGGSPRVNLLPHRYHRYFYVLDLKSAYRSVDLDRLAEVLTSIDPQLVPAETAAVKAFLER